MHGEGAFHGAKIALLCGDRILTYLRDDKPDISWPGLWDLPGGGREGGESVAECLCREVMEEFALAIDPDSFDWIRAYPGAGPGGAQSYFAVAPITADRLNDIRFGSEGQRWALMYIDEFLARKDAIPHLQQRLRHFLQQRTH